jgi:hypothetical protein
MLMKRNYYSLFYITLILGFIAFHPGYAEDTSYVTPTPQLQNIGKNYFKDNEGRVIHYPCSMGGEPLVIYSSIDGKPISSKSILFPVYLKSGYQATPLSIPSYEENDAISHKNLIIQAINPSAGYVSFNLTRHDRAPFYVDTANFPIVDTTPGLEGIFQKYVSIFNVNINNTSDEFAHIDFPTYNYHFEESAGLYIYSYVTHIKANIASWNQNSKWTDGKLGRNLSNIPYRFSPIQEVAGHGIATYDGFGFWICGSDQQDEKPKENNNPQSVIIQRLP